MRIVVKEPGKRPKIREIENTLQELQSIVGGFIETVTIELPDKHGELHTVIIVCNEEGRLMGMPFNCYIHPCDFVGPVLFCGLDETGENFDDIPLCWAEFKAALPQLWESDLLIVPRW